MPDPNRANDGASPDSIHLEMDVSDRMEMKMGCILSHRTQVASDWPYDRVPRYAANMILGREYYIRGWPSVSDGDSVSPDFFEGLQED